jgi:hypothetical protein
VGGKRTVHWRKKIKHVIRIQYIVALFTLALATVTVVSLIYPFQPMHIKEVTLVPDKVCPLELVAVEGKTVLERGNYRITIDPLWINADKSNKMLDEAQVDGYVQGPLVDEDTSSELVYVSPPEVGKWNMTFEVDVEGRVGILPRKQSLQIKASNKLKVVDCGDTYEYKDKK